MEHFTKAEVVPHVVDVVPSSQVKASLVFLIISRGENRIMLCAAKMFCAAYRPKMTH